VYKIKNKERSNFQSIVCSFLRVRDGMSHSYKTTGKIIALNILIMWFLIINKLFQTFSEFYLRLISF
jgi:hypothetical protein